MVDPRVAIFGATGPTGIHLGRILRERGYAVRVISRSDSNLEQAFPGNDFERVAADALDPIATRDAASGCELLVDCIGLPPDRMPDHPATARIIADAGRSVGARCLQVSSFWAFLPVQQLPLDEQHRRAEGNAYIRARREAEDVFLAAGAAVVHLPDFFGPEVHTSTLQRPLEEAASGKAMRWMGSAKTERDHVYVLDAMRMVADLMRHEEAFGRSWIVPGSGPLSARRAAEIAGEHLGREVTVRSAPTWLLELLSVFSPDLRAFKPMLRHYAAPISYDASRLRGLLGELRNTPYELAIPATLDWIASSGSAG
jgi:nucleoside-diphosphate-sugar epimerase